MTLGGLANSRDSNGHFMFAGTMVTTLPFTKNAGGTVVYNGNQTEPKLELDTGYKLAFEHILEINWRALSLEARQKSICFRLCRTL